MEKKLEATIYSADAKKAGTITLPEGVFGVAWNDSLMHQVVTAMQSNARGSTAHTKFRGEVRGGGKKPWAQKGTGRARHGSIRSPIWKGGGVTHGPRSEKNYERTIPHKMRAKALFMALSRKFKDNEIIFVESFGLKTPKTAIAKKSLVALSRIAGFEKLSAKKKNAALIAIPDASGASYKSFRNVGNINCVAARNLNPVSVLGNTFIVIESPESMIEFLSKKVVWKNQSKAKVSN